MRSKEMEKELELQDRSLDDLESAVGTLGRLGREINAEIGEQNAMLLDLDHDMEENLQGLNLISKQTSALVKKAGKTLALLLRTMTSFFSQAANDGVRSSPHSPSSSSFSSTSSSSSSSRDETP